MEEKKVEQKKTTNNSLNIPLTPDVYGIILEEKRNKIVELKKSQCSELEIITNQEKSLNYLKDSLKSIKREIKISRRALRKEKRKLKNINHSLELRSNEMINLTNDFISEEKKYIKRFSFETKKDN